MDVNIEQKIKEIMEDPEKRSEFFQYDELDTTPKQLTDAAHEIVFSVESSIFEQNEKRENAKLKKIHKTNFHMPVPEGDDAIEYMQTFLTHFQESLVNTAKELEDG